MLQVGMLGAPNQKNVSAHPTALTPDEQYSQVTLWCLLSAPLVLSCDLTRIDPFTFNLLANDEVIEVDQDPHGEPARRVAGFSGEVWAKTLGDGSVAVGLFNLGQEERPVAVSWSELGITGNKKSATSGARRTLVNSRAASRRRRLPTASNWCGWSCPPRFAVIRKYEHFTNASPYLPAFP